MNAFSAAVKAEYVDFIKSHDVAADGIVTDPALATKFAEPVRRRTGDKSADVKSVSKALINLRKIGEDKGGLPRSKRGFNGRNNNPR
jgi:hypothetical protein